MSTTSPSDDEMLKSTFPPSSEMALLLKFPTLLTTSWIPFDKAYNKLNFDMLATEVIWVRIKSF